MAAFFGHRFYAQPQPEPSLKGLFRLIDELDQCATQPQRRQVQFFTPKFDLKETETTFELYGELPNISKDNISIEFSDPQTVVIRGKVDRTIPASAPVVAEAKAEEAAGTVDEEPVLIDHDQASETSSENAHRATVEDEVEEGTNTEAQNTPATTVAEAPKPAETPKPAAPKAKYWITERSVGQFARSFQFPSRVEHEAVSAALDNGILTVTVPKAKKHETRRVAIF